MALMRPVYTVAIALVLMLSASSHAGIMDVFATIQEKASAAMEELIMDEEWNSDKAKLDDVPPIVVVPGLTSSNLTYKLDHAANPLLFCPTTQNWTTLWPIPQFKSEFELLCWFENIKAYFNTTTQEFHNRKGEQVSTTDFGKFDSAGVLTILVDIYEQLGWKDQQNLFCAPYDWRVPNAGLEQYYKDLQALVERAYHNNGNKKVVLLAASLGPQIAIGFLHRMTQPWKDMYLKWFIAESPLWSGSPLAMPSLTSGWTAPSTTPESAPLNRLLSTLTFSVMSIFPRGGETEYTFHMNETIVKTRTKSYSAYDFDALYKDVGLASKLPSLDFIRKDSDLHDFLHPGVPTFVSFGFGLGTPAYFEFEDDFHSNGSLPQQLPSLYVNVSGDTVVPERSGQRSKSWGPDMAKNNMLLLHKGYSKQQHALCIAPPPVGSGTCFMEVIHLITKGVIPPNATSNMNID